MKSCLIKLNKTINGKKVNFEFGAETKKDPTKRFRFSSWYYDCYVYSEDNSECCRYTAILTLFSFVRDKVYEIDGLEDLDGGLIREIKKALSIANTVLYKKVFNAVVYSDYADVIRLIHFGYDCDYVALDFNGFDMEERKAVLKIHDKDTWGFDRKYIATFKDGVLRIVGHDDNDSPFCDWDYVHLFQLKYRADFYWTFAEGKYKLQHPTPIFSDGENLIGIEFKAEAVEE